MTTRLVLFGSGEFGVPSFQALAQDPRFTVVSVVSQPPKPSDRGQQLRPTPVQVWAEAAELPVITPGSVRDPDVGKQLAALQADAWVVIAYGFILPPELLALPPRGILNVHASLLPKYRGASPIVAALVAGDQQTGVTFMQIDAGVDTGGSLRTYTELIKPDDTTPVLAERLARLAAQHLPDDLQAWLNQEITPVPQPSDGASRAPKLSRPDGYATWNSAVEWERKVRAYTPWPSVWTTWRGQRLKILAAKVVKGQPTEPPGTVIPGSNQSWMIACQDGYLEPIQIQLAGKRPQAADLLVKNFPDLIGTRLGND